MVKMLLQKRGSAVEETPGWTSQNAQQELGQIETGGRIFETKLGGISLEAEHGDRSLEADPGGRSAVKQLGKRNLGVEPRGSDLVGMPWRDGQGLRTGDRSTVLWLGLGMDQPSGQQVRSGGNNVTVRLDTV